MAPTEETILRSFLLQKAALRDVLTLAEFSSYFPASKRSSPLVRQLYRDLQSQRNAICESVLKQINLECRFGENLVAQTRAARESSRTAVDTSGESQVDVRLFGQADPEFAARLEVVLPEMQNAVRKLRENMDGIQQKIDHTLTQLQRISGDMSDLKYGTTDQHVSKELKELVEASDRLLARN